MAGVLTPRVEYSLVACFPLTSSYYPNYCSTADGATFMLPCFLDAGKKG